MDLRLGFRRAARRCGTPGSGATTCSCSAAATRLTRAYTGVVHRLERMIAGGPRRRRRNGAMSDSVSARSSAGTPRRPWRTPRSRWCSSPRPGAESRTRTATPTSTSSPATAWSAQAGSGPRCWQLLRRRPKLCASRRRGCRPVKRCCSRRNCSRSGRFGRGVRPRDRRRGSQRNRHKAHFALRGGKVLVIGRAYHGGTTATLHSATATRSSFPPRRNSTRRRCLRRTATAVRMGKRTRAARSKCAQAIEDAVRADPRITAVMLEPVVGSAARDRCRHKPTSTRSATSAPA